MSGGKAPRQAGDRFERACVERLRGLGYLVVRSAGSLGPADLWAARSDIGLLLISCKVTNNTTVRDRGHFRNVATEAGGMAVIATKPARGRILFLRVGENAECIPYDIGG